MPVFRDRFPKRKASRPKNRHHSRMKSHGEEWWTITPPEESRAQGFPPSRNRMNCRRQSSASRNARPGVYKGQPRAVAPPTCDDPGRPHIALLGRNVRAKIDPVQNCFLQATRLVAVPRPKPRTFNKLRIAFFCTEHQVDELVIDETATAAP